MARKPSARVVLNRSNLSKVGLAVADGLEAVVRTIVERADPPDATPYGEGLVTRGGWLVYSGPNKVGGGSLQGKQPKKPRKFVVKGTEGTVAAIAGFGFPGHFQELGTAQHGAQPFLWPALMDVVPDIPSILAVEARRHLGRGSI